MNRKLLKICSLVFACLSFVSLLTLLFFSVSLPYTETYRMYGRIYTERYSGYFDTTYLSSMIILFSGTFWGLVIFFALPERERKKVAEEDKSGETASSASSGKDEA